MNKKGGQVTTKTSRIREKEHFALFSLDCEVPFQLPLLLLPGRVPTRMVHVSPEPISKANNTSRTDNCQYSAFDCQSLTPDVYCNADCKRLRLYKTKAQNSYATSSSYPGHLFPSIPVECAVPTTSACLSLAIPGPAVDPPSCKGHAHPSHDEDRLHPHLFPDQGLIGGFACY